MTGKDCIELFIYFLFLEEALSLRLKYLLYKLTYEVNSHRKLINNVHIMINKTYCGGFYENYVINNCGLPLGDIRKDQEHPKVHQNHEEDVENELANNLLA